MADVAVLCGARGKLNGASTRGIVGDESERIELRRLVFAFRVVFLRCFGNDEAGWSSPSPPVYAAGGGGGGVDGKVSG